MAKQDKNPENEVKTDTAEIAGLMVSNHTPPVEIDEDGVTAEILDNDNQVIVDKSQLKELITQNKTMKTEIGQLVALFQFFTPLVNGGNYVTLAMQIPKLLSNKDIAAQVQAVAPIIEKYTITE